MPLDLITDKLIELALLEDLGPVGDVTSRLTIPHGKTGRAEVKAREELVVSGLEVFTAVFTRVDPAIKVQTLVKDGVLLPKGAACAEVSGPAGSLLAAERTGLNFLMRLSGVATLTRAYVLALGDNENAPKLLDTRKTTPGLRALEKAAVFHGGGDNHRFGLYDGIIIKDNHIAAAGSLKAAVELAKATAPMELRVEVEVDGLEQIAPALEAGADILLLDNMDPPTLKEAVKIVTDYFAPHPRPVILEASGGVNLKTIRAIAQTGVDRISVGAITHSARAVDLGLDWL
ncbi:MAG: carboxylating nicotinate-nucleotide diphosphorylase [Deltaproteobacteria bacterium]|nr:carboxylating nicotinate-nucleotide diphosphorylase [Deltaproteobacteria bacterium]